MRIRKASLLMEPCVAVESLQRHLRQSARIRNRLRTRRDLTPRGFLLISLCLAIARSLDVSLLTMSLAFDFPLSLNGLLLQRECQIVLELSKATPCETP